MGNIALILCTEANPPLPDKKSFGAIWENLSKILKRKPYFGALVRKSEIYDDLDCYAVTLPHTLEELKTFSQKKLHKINNKLKAFCSDSHILQCYLPEQLKNVYPFEGSRSVHPHGKLLYRALLNTVLSHIQHKKGIKLRDSDIAIVQGESLGELDSVLMLISPFVKYATVVTKDRSAVESILENIYNETGLSIGVTEDYEEGMKDAHFIVNLGGLKPSPPYPRLSNSAVLLNYSGERISSFPSDNVIVNGIQVNLPSNMLFQLDKGLYEYFSKLEMAELFLLHKLGIQDADERIYTDCEVLLKLSEEFIKDGFKLSGFIGRHESFKLKDTKEA